MYVVTIGKPSIDELSEKEKKVFYVQVLETLLAKIGKRE